MKIASIVLIISVISLYVVDVNSEGKLTFSYTIGDTNGPENWANLDPNSQCKGKRQSPININTGEVIFNNDLNYVQFKKEFTGNKMDVMMNTGKTIDIKGQGIKRKIYRGGLPNTYTLVQYHLHWASNNLVGSEHSINENFYPLEIHFVHWNEEKYANVTEALKHGDGIAALGVLVKVKDPEDQSQILSSGLAHLAKHFDHIKTQGSTVEMTDISFTSLFPEKMDYYRYYGSLTTPHCSESVIWTLFKEPIYATQESLDALRNVEQMFVPFSTNSRPIQPINGRQVFSCCGCGLSKSEFFL